jgi:hypothetical protein
MSNNAYPRGHPALPIEIEQLIQELYPDDCAVRRSIRWAIADQAERLIAEGMVDDLERLYSQEVVTMRKELAEKTKGKHLRRLWVVSKAIVTMLFLGLR